MEAIRIACKKASRVLVYDPYTAEVLTNFLKPGPDSTYEQVYCVASRHIRQLQEDGKLKKYGKVKVTLKELLENPDKYVIICNHKMLEIFDARGVIDDPKTRIIWSMWKEYIDKEPTLANRKDSIILCHSSGHVNSEDFLWFVKELKPKRVLLMHSFYSDIAANLLASLENGPEKIDVQTDHQTITL